MSNELLASLVMATALGALVTGCGGSPEPRTTPAPAKAAEEPSGTLATDEALAALREKLAGGGN